MFDVNQSLLRFWEKEFPQIAPKTNGRGVRQYRKEDVDTIALIYHLVKEKGMTLPGARQKLKDNKEATIRNFEIINRLKELSLIHISEPTRLGMISYAVFCLKKKKNKILIARARYLQHY